ncbi:MAG: hydroxymethylpyrimidine/phosphomethylpyrimidine kinase [Deltaproteobacteria bacterium]|nr:hydroxymethylpyrimidine/phosphomethylpyrimidine kinase [Deltaproteobacteria bacterium]
MNKVLLIAGLDPSGNAGLIRDLEIVHSFPLQAASVVTALTAQNEKKFFFLQAILPGHFENQLCSIAPLSQYRAVKIGMLGNEKLARILVRFIGKEKKRPPIVLDPVIRSSTGGVLLSKKGRKILAEELLPLVSLWTPNLDEASYFSGIEIRNAADMEKGVEALWKKGRVPVLLKGGHLKGEKVQDLFFDGAEKTWFIFGRRRAKKLRGTGCALSALIACFMAEGFPLTEAVRQGRIVMQKWIQSGC